MVVMNKNATLTSIDTKRFTEILKEKISAKNVLTNQKQELKNPLMITPKSTLVFEIE
jgi:hypothetical protein